MLLTHPRSSHKSHGITRLFVPKAETKQYLLVPDDEALQSRIPKATVSEVIYAVPRLLQLLNSSSLAAVLATARAYCQQVREFVEGIIITDSPHMEVLIRGRWPRLICWFLRNTHKLTRTGPNLVHVPWLDATIMLLVAKGLLKTLKLSCCQGYDACIGVEPSLLVKYEHVHASSIHQMSSCIWVSLERLYLSNNPPNVVSHFIQGSFPELQYLDVGCSSTRDVKGVYTALTGLDCMRWPLLKSFNVSANSFSATGIGHLVLSLPQCLTNLNLAYVLSHLGVAAPAVVASLTQAGLNNLQTLDLSHNNLNGEAFAELPKANWSRLQYLALQCNSIDAAAVSDIVKCRFPLLMQLNIWGYEVDAEGVRELVKGEWPLLQTAELTLGLFDDDSMIGLGLDPQQVLAIKKHSYLTGICAFVNAHLNVCRVCCST